MNPCVCLQGGKAEKAAKLTCSSQAKTPRRGSKDAGEKGNVRHPEQESSSPSLLHRAAGSFRLPKPTRLPSLESALTVQISDLLVNPGSEAPETKQPLPYKPSGPPLSLFRRQKTPLAEDCNSRLRRRRGSEPERQMADQAATFARARLPSDPGLKPPQTEQQARFCLSPKAVRDYFSSQPRGSPQSRQEVALAVVEGGGEWLKRCSDPSTVEPDLEQLLFSEESYV